VVDQSSFGLAASKRHLQRVEDEIGPHVLRHRPADYAAREGILYRSQVNPALPAAQVGDVGDRQLDREV
jgi:hypothetical protein